MRSGCEVGWLFPYKSKQNNTGRDALTMSRILEEGVPERPHNAKTCDLQILAGTTLNSITTLLLAYSNTAFPSPTHSY